MPISFSWALDAGQVLNIISILAGGMWFLAVFKAQLNTLHDRVGSVELEIKKMSEVIVSNARLDERVTALSLRVTAVETLRNGH